MLRAKAVETAVVPTPKARRRRVGCFEVGARGAGGTPATAEITSAGRSRQFFWSADRLAAVESCVGL